MPRRCTYQLGSDQGVRSLKDIEAAIMLGALSGEYSWSVRCLDHRGRDIRPEKRRAHLFPGVEADAHSLCNHAELMICHPLTEYLTHNYYGKRVHLKYCYKCLCVARRILDGTYKESNDAD